MVKRGGRDIIPVDIWKDNYSILKTEAIEKRYSIKDYINTILESVIKKNAFLEKYAPYLKVDGLRDNTIQLIDENPKKGRRFVDVQVKNHELVCLQDETNNCVHCYFVWAIPEVAKLNLKRPPELR
jgi:hypothetical protein